MRSYILYPCVFLVCNLLGGGTALVSVVHAQSFGVELHNTLTPASGAMAGTSLARPQDLQSAVNANPATLTQFRGTHLQDEPDLSLHGRRTCSWLQIIVHDSIAPYSYPLKTIHRIYAAYSFRCYKFGLLIFLFSV